MRSHHMGSYAAAISLALMVAAPARAQDDSDSTSGGYWLRRCSAVTVLDIVSCNSMMIAIVGFRDLDDYRMLFCPPPGVTLGQAKAVIVKYLEDNPKQLHLPFVPLAIDALQSQWPCPKQTN